ncbi:MAG: PDZ domain-containing protein [Deltaproteobacteria bacterium]|nr:PDZ domain-containing protein [Deltaproteobacteria bacterium]
MMRTAMVGLAGTLVGALLVWWLIDDPNAETPRPSARSESSSARVLSVAERATDVEQLRAELEIEREMRRRLADEIQSLKRPLLHAASDSVDADAQELRDPGTDPRERPRADALSAADGAWFSTSDLRSLGLDEREIERIQEVWDRYEMARIELMHRVAREGKEGKKGHKKIHARDRMAIDLRARDDLGDDGYDALLYASGQENRVILSEILETSPAAAAGLLRGDELIGYDGQRIFRPRDILHLISLGESGEWVEVIVKREGRVQRLHVQRGPLGVRLGTDRRVPYLD